MGEQLHKQYAIEGGDYKGHLAGIYKSESGFTCRVLPGIINPNTHEINADFSINVVLKENNRPLLFQDEDSAYTGLERHVREHGGTLNSYTTR